MLFSFTYRFFSSGISSIIFTNGIFAHLILANVIFFNTLFGRDDMHHR